ncbi:MAG: hypothetical protein LBG12_02455, partial [Synergistaceae bacterium]|nr:hypothetical protein [Synergistaceae bacterium]
MESVNLENFWSNVLEKLPLAAAEGGQYTEADAESILEPFGKDAPRFEAALALVQEVLGNAGLLDPIRLAEGKWRFVSYQARLFACSLISLLSNKAEVFPRGFWAADMNASLSEQHRVLHLLETQRSGTRENYPIRRTFVAWGIIKRGRHFILKRRENHEGDPDNSLHGRYSFPGGRVNMNDITLDHKLAFLYGIPKPVTGEEERALEDALEHALVRELHEELGLSHKTHYTFAKAACEILPETFIHGANAHHCITECRITPFDIFLTQAGDAFLASNLKQEELFTLDDILHPRSEERRVFFNTGHDPLIKYLENAADSAGTLQITQSELSRVGTKPKKNDDAVSAILPIAAREPLLIGDIEIPIEDPRYIALMLLLGFCARGYGVNMLSDAAERKNWGWVKLNEEQRTLAHSFDRSAAQCCGVRILAVDGSLCRLRLAEENIFFSHCLFRA